MGAVTIDCPMGSFYGISHQFSETFGREILALVSNVVLKGFQRHGLIHINTGGISVRDVSSMNASFGDARPSLLKTDDEWRNINTMLNCILSMVEKTKRALAILQQRGERGAGGQLRHQARAAEIMAAAVRQTEDRVADVRRRAEDAVNQSLQTAHLNVILLSNILI
ncbi:unnamed protein product [Plutella xylostella]|uniref:(diamondback moth) hypothetical protein n=1 Tax=Plutella xylostella TaxID=51655 RepID=A0A8S4FSC4_PLUXY|nr:unnamed protein product [Plutella xylostella]